MGSFLWVIIFLAVVVFFYMPYMKKQMAKKQAVVDAFLAEHPEASKVFLSTGIKGLSSDQMTVLGVDGEPPMLFYDGRRQGVVLLPGQHVVEVAYGWTRPGLLHKNVTTQVEPSKQEVEIEARREYLLSYDRDGEHYVFEEKGVLGA